LSRRAGPRRYLPAEDTALLRSALRPFSGRSCLEIGFGSGAILSDVSRRFRLSVGTDILGVEDAKLARAPRIDLVLADRAAAFRERVFDLVFFNPPYLPSPRVVDSAVDGGRAGVEVPLAFLEEGVRVLRENGRLVVLLSEEGDLDSFIARCEGMGLSVEEIERRGVFFETLVVLKIERKSRN